MNRKEFIGELEYLLQDIPDEEKEDAMAYYRDYLEEAGEDREEDVIREFGSPERIAAIIRAGVEGNLDGGGTFTETGYEDERYRDPNYQVANRRELPEVSENTSEKKEGKGQAAGESRMSRLVKVLLLLGGLCLISPVLLGVGGGVFGIAVALLAVAAVILFLVGVLTVVLSVLAVALIAGGIVTVFVQPWTGLVILGAGVLVLGFALLSIVVSVLFYGKLLPFVIRSCTDLISRLLHRGRRRPA